METSPDTETRDIVIKERTIKVQPPTNLQLMLMSRDIRTAQREDAEKSDRLTAVGRLFDILESLVVGQDDKDYLVRLATSRELDMEDLLPMLRAFKDEEPEKPKVRRGARTPAKAK